MITIREAQMEAFKAARKKEFRDRLTAYIFELNLIEPGRIVGEIEAGIASVEEVGLELESDIAEYVITVCRYLGGFSKPLPTAAVSVLKALGVPAHERLAQFRTWCAQHGNVG